MNTSLPPVRVVVGWRMLNALVVGVVVGLIVVGIALLLTPSADRLVLFSAAAIVSFVTNMLSGIPIFKEHGAKYKEQQRKADKDAQERESIKEIWVEAPDFLFALDDSLIPYLQKVTTVPQFGLAMNQFGEWLKTQTHVLFPSEEGKIVTSLGAHGYLHITEQVTDIHGGTTRYLRLRFYLSPTQQYAMPSAVRLSEVTVQINNDAAEHLRIAGIAILNRKYPSYGN